MYSKTLQPVNRHLVIDPVFSERKTESGVYLPEEFVNQTEKHITAKVLNFSKDCSENLRELISDSPTKEVVIDTSMIEKISVNGEECYTILENYIVGVL